MPHVVLQHCCAEASCTVVCPVNCIQPSPGAPGFTEADMLYVDPAACIDCGACADVCPVDAILPDYALTGPARRFIDINAEYFATAGRRDYVHRRDDRPPALVREPGPGLRVAVVGAGPAGSYVVDALTDWRGPAAGIPVQVDVYERLDHPGGLARYGVAPDHALTRRMERSIADTLARSGVAFHGGVHIGRDLDLATLQRTHDAVVYASGAPVARRLGIPGEELEGVFTAAEFVAWYNGHPDAPTIDLPDDITGAVVIGNGNVALDVARLLVSPAERLRPTAMASAAVAAIGHAAIRCVDVIGRGGVERAAFTTSELLGLVETPGITVSSDADTEAVAALDTLRRRVLAARPTPAQVGPTKSGVVNLRFGERPIELLGDGHLTGVRLGGPGGTVRTLDCQLLISAIGFRGGPVDGLPFDEERGVVPNSGGRVEPGVYVAGWIKRGPSGQLGHNRECARETVARLVEDHLGGLLGGGVRCPR